MRFIQILSILLLLSACSNDTEQHLSEVEHDHEHNGSSSTEAMVYRGQSDIQAPYHIETIYSQNGSDIYDVEFKIYDGDYELISASSEGTLANDTDPSLADQIQRLKQYIIGFNKFPELDSAGHSDELITISIDMSGLADSFENAQ